MTGSLEDWELDTTEAVIISKAGWDPSVDWIISTAALTLSPELLESSPVAT